MKLNTIKIFLAESGRIADLKKDFPLYQGQYQNKLLNVFVPTSILAPNFSVQESGNTIADYVSSTAVKIGMRTIERNGKINTSKTYYMRYLKTLTYQNVEYALYERKLPREFTFYAGQGENAPVLIANVVNVNNETTPATIIEITPSQTCSLDVMPSGYLDTDEPIEATALEEINSRLNAIDEDLAKKQNIQDNTLETTAKTIVGAINENKGRIDINTQNIETNRQNIAGNRNDIDYLLENMSFVEDYIGQLTGTSLPTNEQLTTFVRNNTDPSREPKNADVVIFVLQVAGGTDKNYKYIYSTTGWNGYEIPPMEMASNGTLGILKGTYAIGSTNDTLVDISSGEILNIYVKDNTGTYRNIREYLNTTTTNIDNIISGNTSVGLALRSIADGLGNNIVNTYLTQTLGATKQYVRDYAMPREFNDVYFIATAGYLEQVPTTPESGIQFTTTTNAVADFQLFQIQKTNTADFELSSKNGYSNNIYVSASVNCRVAFRLTTQYKKLGQDWADLNVELTSPINLTAGDIEKIMFGNPFTSLEENVISLTDGDLIRQTLEVVSQTSETITFNVYSNDIYPSTFNLTSQSYVLSDVEQSVSRLILLGTDGVVEATRVVFDVQNADSYIEFRTNQREFLINGHLPIVGELDDTLPVYITFGEKTYGVFSYMKGSSTPITIGDLKSNMTYNQATGYSFTSKMIFLETSDYVGFVISPATITAEQLINIIEDTETVVISLDSNGTKLNIQLSADVVNKLRKTLVTPISSPSTTELVGVNNQNMQTMIELGNGLVLTNDVLNIQLNDTLAPFVSYAVSQSLTDEQKALARANIGAGASGFSGSYPDLSQKPVLNTSNTASQTAQADEIIDGTINLHKISKTGALADTIQDNTHRTVTDAEKQTWNNKSDFDGSFNSLTNVPQASTGVAGVIQIATDNEAETGTNTTKAVNPKQLKTAIDGLGSVFTLKGSVANVGALPSTGNEIGDVYYVVSESVGYIWLNDGTTNRWEQLGLPIDLSGYVQFTDIINALNSTASDKPLSAMQGKVLNDQLNSLATQLGTANTNISTLQTKALVKPTTAPSNFELVGIDNSNSQTMVDLGDRIVVENNELNLSDGTITTLDFAESERQKSLTNGAITHNGDASVTFAESERQKSITDGAIVHEKQITDVEHIETIYDMSSSDSNINWGNTAGILLYNELNIVHDFSGFKKYDFIYEPNTDPRNLYGSARTITIYDAIAGDSVFTYFDCVSPSNCYAVDLSGIEIYTQFRMASDKQSVTVMSFQISSNGSISIIDSGYNFYRLIKIVGYK